MRKLFVSLLAVATLAACSNEDVVRQPESNAIRFDGMFVENATRAEDPSLTKDNLNAFDVWGFMNETTAEVFNGTDVTRMGDMWYYDVPQYWLKGNTYYFAALAPMNSENVDLTVASGEAAKLGLGKIAFTNVDGSEDLIYASTSVKAEHSGNEAVKFTFNHLLSKIKFTFINGFAHDNITVDVEDVKMVAPKSGTIDLAVENWWDNDDWKLNDETLTLEFGNVERMGIRDVDGKTAAKERLTVPATADYAYAVSFIANVYVGDQKTVFERTATIEGAAFEMGKAYNLVATISPETLDLEEIVFEVVEVKDWIEQDMNCGEFGDNTVFVSNRDELQAALDAATGDTTISLGADLEGDVTVTQKPDVTITVEGNGHNYKGVIVVDGKSATYLSAGLTIKDLNFVADSISADACIRLGNGTNATRYTCNVTVDNCTFDVAGAVAVKSYTGGDKNLTITNCTATAKTHSLVQAKGINGIHVKGCTILSKNGMNFNNSTYVVVDNCVTDVKGYAVRFGEGSVADAAAEVYAIKNSTLKAACEDGDSVIILRGTAANSTLTINNTTIEGVSSLANNANNAKVIIDGAEASVAATADELNAAIAAAAPGSVVVLTGDDYGTIALGELKDVTLEGYGAATVVFSTDANSKLENVTVKGMDFVYDGSAAVNCGLVINADAQIENLVVENCTFVGTGAKAGRGIYGQNPNATIVLKGCTFSNMGYPIYTMAGGGYKSLEVVGCAFDTIKSWAIMPQYNNYLGDLTVDGCTFTNCVGGLVKAGAFTAGHTFAFTNNTITNSAEHPAKNWFTIDTTAATAVVSGNTKDGAAWTPGVAEGLK